MYQFILHSLRAARAMTSASIGKVRKLATVGDGPINNLEASMTLALNGRKVSRPEFATSFLLNLSTMMLELSSSSSAEESPSLELVFSSPDMSSAVIFFELAYAGVLTCLHPTVV